MFKSFTFGRDIYPHFQWNITDDSGFTTIITDADCNNLFDAIILVYERRGEPVVPNLMRLLNAEGMLFQSRLAVCKQCSALYRRYEKDIERYLVLL